MKNPESRLEITEEDKGFVSIFSVLMIMAVLALIMVGFSQIVRRAAVSNLNDQLSTQAFYAAESGVNAVATYLKNAGANAEDKPKCQENPHGYNFSYNNNLNSSLQVGYSCVLINLAAPDIRFSSVPVEGTAAPKSVRFETGNPANIPTAFDITMSSTGSTTTISNGQQGPSRASSDIGILRVDMVPTEDPANPGFDRANLVNNTYTFFVDFTTGAGTANVVHKGVNSGDMIKSHCAAAPCKTSISLSGASASAYVMRLQSIYNPVAVTIDNVTGPTGVVRLVNGQTIADVTGYANSVYRRIQVRLPADGILSSSFAIESADSICKRLEVAPGNTTTSGGADPSCATN